MSEALNRLSQKTYRLRRHLSSLVRFGSPYRYYNIALAETERLLGRDKVKSRPYILIIDPLNTCNLRCPCCPTGRGELPLKGGKMRLEQFQALLDQIAPHTIKILLYNWGEPFLHKEILPMVRYAYDRRISTALSSNLNIMPQGGARAIVESGVQDLIVSCDGLTQETYEQYRVRGKLENVVNNLKEIAQAKRELKSKTPVIEFQFLAFRHNEHEIPNVERRAKQWGANFVRVMAPYINFTESNMRPTENPLYRKDYYEDEETEKNRAPDVFEPDADLDECAKQNPPPIKCFWPWRSIAINWGGQIDPCCMKNYHESFGNAFEKPFGEIWNNDVYRYARRWISGKAINDAPRDIVCRGCAGYR